LYEHDDRSAARRCFHRSGDDGQCSTIPGIVEVNLEAKIAPINVNGVTANLMTYNGTYPAPTIKVKKGDLLRVHFKNSLPYTGVNMMGEDRDLTNLHTHGLHVSPEGNSDNGC